MAESARSIANISELVDYFHAGAKTPDQQKIGVEHEKIIVCANGSAPDFALITRLLAAIRDTDGGWREIREQDRLIGLDHPIKGSVSLEPGGQLEHSGRPWRSLAEAISENEQHLTELVALAPQLDIRFLAVGFRPIRTLDEVPWMPKGRYDIMRAYLPTRGRLAHEMMKRTATVQANFDYIDESDAMAKMRLAQGLSPLVVALFAASPIVEGKPSGYQSYRAHVWRHMDPDRSGLLKFLFEKKPTFSDYVDWALDVPMFFVVRNKIYHRHHATFRDFLAHGWQGEHATMADWEMHLSTLFPEVRLKQFVEVRQGDASTIAMARALPALWAGIFADPSCQDAAWQLVADWSWSERLLLADEVPHRGLSFRTDQIDLRKKCHALLEIAAQGLAKIGQPAGFLAPLVDIVETGVTVADRIVERWQSRADEKQQLDSISLTTF